MEVLARFGEDPLQDLGHGEDRRPHIEAVALFLQNRGLAAQPGVLLEQGDVVSSGRQSAGRSQSTQTSANDSDSGFSMCHGAHFSSFLTRLLRRRSRIKLRQPLKRSLQRLECVAFR